ncbi:MAG: HEAT repeat domain-containing protein, partial [Candidatus Thorarchaeota archaeon]
MSFNSDQLDKKIKTMEEKEAVEMLFSLLTSSKTVESKIKATELLNRYSDNEKNRFQELKTIFLNDQHPQLRLGLIDLLIDWYKIDCIGFLKEQYKNCKDGSVRAKLIGMVGQLNLDHSIPFLIEALNDSDFEVKKKAIVFLGKTE